MYIRGSSRKEKFDRNEKLYVYFLHKGRIYAWKQLTKYSRYDEIEFVSDTESEQLLTIKDGQYMFLQDIKDEVSGKLVKQKVIKLQTNFSMYQLITYIERFSDPKDKIREISMDHMTNIILVYMQAKINSAESDQVVSSLKLFDINQNKTTYEIKLTNETLIGRLKSGLFTVNQGHIYFNNNFIKIRYDLIFSGQNYKYKEEQIFDFYSGIFDLGKSI